MGTDRPAGSKRHAVCVHLGMSLLILCGLGERRGCLIGRGLCRSACYGRGRRSGLLDCQLGGLGLRVSGCARADLRGRFRRWFCLGGRRRGRLFRRARQEQATEGEEQIGHRSLHGSPPWRSPGSPQMVGRCKRKSPANEFTSTSSPSIAKPCGRPPTSTDHRLLPVARSIARRRPVK